jgi:plasmid stabilization system protein ParE
MRRRGLDSASWMPLKIFPRILTLENLDVRRIPVKLVVTKFPYLIVYTVEHAPAASEKPQAVVILRVLHGAMQWPPREQEG